MTSMLGQTVQDVDDFATDCEICEQPHPVDSLTQTADGYDVCDSCLTVLSECERCDDVYRYTDGFRGTVDGESVCELCASSMDSCSECGDLGTWRNLTSIQNGNQACESCLYDHYTSCYYCGEWYSDFDSCENGCGGGDYGGLVNDYGYKPRPQFHGGEPSTKGLVFMGMELEVNYADYTCAELAQDHLGALGYLKEDCSLDQGFEIVTHPMTHEYVAESFPWDMIRDLRDRGAESDGAGLHVHVNRSAFNGPAHIYRWLRLIYRNQNALTMFSRRDEYALNEWAGFDLYNTRAAKEHAKGSRGGRRHAAVNVTNSATFEVRLFASSLNVDEVRAALDFVHASVEYTRSLTVPVVLAGGWSWSAFRAWVEERPEYTALASEMSGIDTDEDAPPPAKRVGWKRPTRVQDVPCGCSACRDVYAELEGGL